jgi:hypothetical protein
MSFYIKKTWVDSEPGIELVNLHYTWTPLGAPPNWEAHRETRVMPRGGTLIRGMGGTTLDEQGNSVQTTMEKIELPDDGVRRKVIRLPKDVHNPATDRWEENYLFHHYFEVFRHGHRDYSPLFTEEVVVREVDFINYDDNLCGGCCYWSVYDWDAFERTRSDMIRALPSPRRFVSRVQGPKGATVHFCWHTGPFWSPNPADRWEDYRYHTSVVL